ncbi:MAG: 2,4'-dihydroxyacetophenone dioxygenase family protein [Pseudomonadota bacterium]
MIPLSFTHQDKLMSLNMNDLPFYETPELPGIKSQPLFLDIENSVWVLHIKFAPGTRLPKHFHTGCVHMWTLSGSWYYLEYPDQVQTAGCYLYEPGGSVHTFVTSEDNTEDTEAFIYQTGTNIHFDENDNYMNTLDAGVISMLVNAISEAQGNGPARYIRGQSAVDNAA